MGSEMTGGVPHVQISAKSYVKPKNNLGRRECHLTTFDLPYLAFYYNQKLLLYAGGAIEGKVGKLKESLSTVLECFFQLAGKVCKDEDGAFMVVYDDDMEGVEVVEAVAEDVSLSDLGGDNGSGGISQKLIPYNGISNLEGLHRPLLALQLTKLKDGIAMGCAFNHAILDGTSTWHFMTSWAEICRGNASISREPLLDRMKVRNTRVCLDLSLPQQDLPTTDAKPQQPLVEKVFKFSEEAINVIKQKANTNQAPDAPEKPFSTFQSLAVHIWRHVSAARRLKHEDYTVFTVFVDCRKRVDPPLPENYFGNLIQAIFTLTDVGSLLTNPPNFGALLIQRSIEMHNAKAIDERNKEWEKAPKIFQYKDAGVNCVAVGSSPRFPVYGVDFGWGKPETVRSGSNNKFDGMVFLYQGKAGGRSIDAEISLPCEVMERLGKDEEFFFEL